MVRILKVLVLMAVVVMITGCASTNYCNLDRILTEDGQEFEHREDYIKAAGLDQNPINPVVAINITPYQFKVPHVPNILFCNRYGNAELCIAKAIKEVIPNAAVYFDKDTDLPIVYSMNKFRIGDNALLVKRSNLVSGLGSFAEIYGNLKLNNEVIELNGATLKLGFIENTGKNYWHACLDVANQIADILVKKGILRESDIKKAQVPK
jgi:hypothetical protein